MVGIFPNEDAITRLVGAILFEQNDGRGVERRRYMTLGTIAPLGDDPAVSLPAIATDRSRPMPAPALSYTTLRGTIIQEGSRTPTEPFFGRFLIDFRPWGQSACPLQEVGGSASGSRQISHIEQGFQRRS